jgi:hypothetical protein
MEGKLCTEHLFDNLPDRQDRNHPPEPESERKVWVDQIPPPLKKKAREFR